MQAFESVSTWRQPIPPPASAGRTALIAALAGRIAALALAGSGSRWTA